jgi:hypothetical protein
MLGKSYRKVMEFVNWALVKWIFVESMHYEVWIENSKR